MKRYIAVGLVATPFITHLSSCSGNQEVKRSKPNVIVILADDLGYGDMSSYGAKAISTPNLDKLANSGVRFTDAHATSATSTPSRYALLTGVYPWKNKNAKILSGDAPLLIDTEQYTMADMFKNAGYSTAAIGKWHLGMGAGNPDWNKQVSPGASDIGFDYSNLIAATNDRVPTVFVENGNVVGRDANDPIQVSYSHNFEGEPTALTNPEMLKMEWAHGHNNSIVNGIPRIGYMKGGKDARWVDEDMADYFLGKVSTYIEENSDKPFFLYYGLHQPHVPRAPHSRFVGSTELGPRGDAIVEADWCVGELIKKLEKEGILENTLIIFSSDNGPVLNDGYKDGAKESLPKHNPLGKVRGGKYSLFDGGTRVPMFTYWKGEIKPRVCNALTSQLDLMASLAALIEEKIPNEIDSKNYIDLFLGKNNTSRSEIVVEAGSRLALRSGKYALVPPYAGAKRNETGNEIGTVEDFSLFDLEADISQQKDIAPQNKELTDRLKSDFIKITKGYYNPNSKPIVLE